MRIANRIMNDGATGQGGLDSQAHRHDRHQCLVGHRVDHRPHDRLQIPFPRDPAIDQVGDAGVDEEHEGRQMLLVDDEVADDGGGEQAREGEDVGEGVDVFVGVEGGEQAHGDSWASASPGRVRLFPTTDIRWGQGEYVGGCRGVDSIHE